MSCPAQAYEVCRFTNQKTANARQKIFTKSDIHDIVPSKGSFTDLRPRCLHFLQAVHNIYPSRIANQKKKRKEKKKREVRCLGRI